jgi:hypothetical protein
MSRRQDSGYWHDRAMATRAKAKEASDPRTRELILKMAEEYEAVAQLVDQRDKADRADGGANESGDRTE